MPTKTTRLEEVLRSVAAAAWDRQAHHERFLFKKGRPAGHPSREAWVAANNLWRDQVRARKARRLVAT